MRWESVMVETSDSLVRIERIKILAEQVFSDRMKADRWLNEGLAILGGATPLELLQTDAGAECIEQILAKIDWGAPA